MPASTPDVSILVPTYGRPAAVRDLLASLARQTLDPARFEVVVVDDGSPEPVALAPGDHPFATTLLRQENAGPAAARNRGLEACRGALTLILNDDAVPHPELLREHLDAHAAAPARTAVLGSFPFTAEARRHPFVQVLEGSDLLFDFPGLRPGKLHGWTFFWTCNLSLPTDALRAVGGFDAERFRDAIVEDVELGYRLEQQGWKVLYHPEARCEHDHVLTPEAYFRRHVLLGKNLARMARKYDDPRFLWLPEGVALDAEFRLRAQATVEAQHAVTGRVLQKLRDLEERLAGTVVPPGTLETVRGLVRKTGNVPFLRGMLLELDGGDPGPALDGGPPEGERTSVVVVSHQSLDQLRRCVEALRRCAEPAHPIELIIVDNGSTDGSAEWLEQQDDVVLLRNESNLGAPRARNQALAHARGAWVAFLDSDAMVTPGWLGRLLHHGAVDAGAACVGPVTNRAAHGQAIEAEGLGTVEARDALAASRRAERPLACRYASLMSSFCILVRRSTIDRIGGFDERFGPWGFEDDDFTLRARLAGGRLRVAQDVFVEHEGYAGPKLERHDDLLVRNWRRFAAKWGLPNAHRHGDYSGLAALAARTWSDEALRVPPESPAALPAEPARTVAAAPTPRIRT